MMEAKRRPIGRGKNVTTEHKPKQVPIQEGILYKMFVRSVVGTLLMLWCWFLLKMGHTYVACFLAFGQLVTWREVVSLTYKVTKEQNLWGFRTLNWFWMFVAFFWFYSKPVLKVLPEYMEQAYRPVPTFTRICGILYEYNDGTVVALYLLALVLFVWSLQNDTLKYQINQLAWTVVALLLVVGQAQFAIRYTYLGLIWVVLPHGLIMVNDIMAYFCGVALGRKIIDYPLTSLSPKKTWEGFFGALLCTVCNLFPIWW
eukprot:TRINITY_DN351_c0_g2_i15.p1 TRINITY_DN351_c0_g2~~TRINITY_DN351_c0_g2_i15.p1  ORF type:complete len:257 (+),score=30.15 TRINITY_DN351_c0_g2_i15:66-836(+)